MKVTTTTVATERVPILGWTLGIGLFLALLLLVQRSVGWSAILSPWREMPPGQLVGAFALVLGSYGLRTVRVHRFFAPETSGEPLRSFRLILLHNLFNNLLPARSGEASFPVLMKREFRVPFSRSLYIERDDFREDPPKKYFRLGPGREVRLRYGSGVGTTPRSKRNLCQNRE